MNIGFICNEIAPAPVGGIGTFTAEIARALNDIGHTIHIISIDKGARVASMEVLGPNLAIHRVPGGQGRLRGYLSRVKLYRLVHELATRKRIDIIEVPDFEGWCAGWGHLPIPVLVRLHGSAAYFAAEMGDSISSSVKLLERLAIQRADHVVSVSRYTAARSEEIFGFPLAATVIYNSVMMPDRGRAKSDFTSRDLVCYSGTLVRKKGVFSLARAWPLVKQRRPNARLMMIGRDGGYLGKPAIDMIRELAGSYADSIEWMGYRTKAEVETLLTGADIAVYPSYSETFALAPMEAMALCVPTIYTTRASGPELIRHNIDGCLCDPDEVGQLADQIVTLLENEPLRRRLGEAGRRRITEGCSYGTFLQNNLSFYRRCIGRSLAAVATAGI